MAGKLFTVEEVIDQLEGDNSDESDLAYLEEKESLDGDREEAEYVKSQGEEEVLSSAMTSALGNLVVNDADPASRDSMLLLDSDLESISDSDMEVDPASSVSYSTSVMTQYHLQKTLKKAKIRVMFKVEGVSEAKEEVVDGVLVEVVEGVLVEVVEGVQVEVMGDSMNFSKFQQQC